MFAFAFNIKDKLIIIKRFIDLEFHIYSKEFKNDRVLNKIKKRIVSTLVEFLRNLCRVIKEFT